MFIIRESSKNPIFIQIIDQVKQFISIGVLQPNDKLPSIRNLAEELGVNPNTVAKAYSELEEECIIVSQYKKGYFVAVSNVAKEVEENAIKVFQQELDILVNLDVQKEKVVAMINQAYQ